MDTNNGIQFESYTGISGATVEIHGDRVIKFGRPGTPVGDRVIAQGRFCQSTQSRILPRIKSVNAESCLYEMELLSHLPWSFVDHTQLFMDMYIGLFEQLWMTGNVNLIDNSNWPRRHREYIEQRARDYAPDHSVKLLELFDRLKHWQLRKCLIHGDPTFDNCMQRQNGELVIIDPIPSDQKIPGLVCVDVGKMLQSAAGYERIKFGRETHDFNLEKAVKLLSLTEPELSASLYFCAAHYVRLLPYQHNLNFSRAYNHILGEVLEYASRV